MIYWDVWYNPNHVCWKVSGTKFGEVYCQVIIFLFASYHVRSMLWWLLYEDISQPMHGWGRVRWAFRRQEMPVTYWVLLAGTRGTPSLEFNSRALAYIAMGWGGGGGREKEGLVSSLTLHSDLGGIWKVVVKELLTLMFLPLLLLPPTAKEARKVESQFGLV